MLRLSMRTKASDIGGRMGDEVKMKYECYYCDKGKVAELPATCPECGHALKRPFNEMPAEDQQWAWIEKHTGMTKDGKVEITLAS
jgi:hypothetical protein